MFSKDIYKYLKYEKILFVDDDKQVTNMFYNLFSKGLSLDTYKAYDGSVALDVFKTHKPTLIITDIKMPMLNGHRMAKQILKRDKTVKIIFLSSYKEEFYENSLSEYYDRIIYLTKPITTFKLENAIYKLYDTEYGESCEKDCN